MQSKQRSFCFHSRDASYLRRSPRLKSRAECKANNEVFAFIPEGGCSQASGLGGHNHPAPSLSKGGVPTHPPSPSRHREGAQPHLLGARSLRYRSLKAVAVKLFTQQSCDFLCSLRSPCSPSLTLLTLLTFAHLAQPYSPCSTLLALLNLARFSHLAQI